MKGGVSSFNGGLQSDKLTDTPILPHRHNPMLPPVSAYSFLCSGPSSCYLLYISSVILFLILIDLRPLARLSFSNQDVIFAGS